MADFIYALTHFGILLLWKNLKKIKQNLDL